MGSNPTLSAISSAFALESGDVTEWSKVHDWKSCVPQGTKGSNPFVSAISLRKEGPPVRGGDGRVLVTGVL